MLNHTSILTILPFQIHSTQGINLGLFAGDTAPNWAPIIVKKLSRKAPVIINVHYNPFIPPLPRPKLTTKLPPLKLSDPIRSLSPLRKSFFPLPSVLPLIKALSFVPLALKRPILLPKIPIIPKIPIPATLPSLLLRRAFQPITTSIITPVYPLRSTPFTSRFSREHKTSLKPLKIPILKKIQNSKMCRILK